jgi:hypothetical protein
MCTQYASLKIVMVYDFPENIMVMNDIHKGSRQLYQKQTKEAVIIEPKINPKAHKPGVEV